MVKDNITKIGLSIATASILFIGCGSSGGSSAPSNTVEGEVSDGLISGATVKLMDGNTTINTTTTDASGKFAFTDTIDSTKSYIIVATGGTDIDTKEDFSGVNLKAPLSMFYSDKKSAVVSPLTSLVVEELQTDTNLISAMNTIKDKLGVFSVDDLKTAPHTKLALQKKAMKLSLMAKEGIAFSSINTNLDNTGGIDNTDIEAISSDVDIRKKLKDANSDLDSSSSLTDIKSVYKKKRIIREIIANKDLNASATNVFQNVKALAAKWQVENITNAEVTSSFIGTDINFSVDTTSFDATSYAVKKVTEATFSNSLDTLYYEIDNPKTGNKQLLAYDYTNKKAHVVNTNVILKDKVFIYGGEKDGTKSKYTEKKYGLYLDPEQENETRTGSKFIRGQQTTFTYNFYADNALKKFNPKKPSEISFIFKSSDIPSDLQNVGIKKLGAQYKVYENIVDTDNSYVSMLGFTKLADTIKGESSEAIKQSPITIRLGDNKAVAGEPIMIVKDGSSFETSSLLVSYTAPHVPSSSTPTYELRKYSKDLISFEKVANGKFYKAGANSNYVYLYKEGSDKLWAMAKSSATLTEVTGITLAGNFTQEIHKIAANKTSDIGGAGITLGGSSKNLSNGDNAYVAFHYDLHYGIADLFIFGAKGAYKSAQVFKLTGTSGSKIFDNGDSTDESGDNAVNTDPNNGNINLIAVTNNKLYIETGWHDGNSTIGGNCTTGYPSPMANNGKGCVKVKYGYLDLATADANTNDTTPLNYDDNNNSLDKEMKVTGLPYFVSRRVAPFASDDKLYISLFAGGSSRTGYKHNLYTFDLDDVNTTAKKEGRTYFVKSAKSTNGNYSGNVISWSKTTNTVTKPDGTIVANTAPLLDSTGAVAGGRSVSALTTGVPLAGFGKIGMLKNDKGGHKFQLFTVDSEATEDSFQDVDLAPFGGWIYE